MIDLDFVVPIIVAIFGGGGLIAFFKLRGENALTSVDAAEGAVVVQSSVIDSLREQLTALSERVDEAGEIARSAEARAVKAEARAAESEVRAVASEARAVAYEREKEALAAVNIDLRLRVTQLEEKVRKLGE